MASRTTLPNGLTLVLEEQHAAKVAAFQVWVKAGSADERQDQAGIAHLHEHMLFKGTARRGPGEMAYAIEGFGGEVNAWTSFDQTVYHVVLASEFAREGLEILADAVRFPAFDAGELSREIEVVCEEIKRSEDSPARRSSRQLFSTAYLRHPYRDPVLGTEASVRSFTRDKVLEFYRHHYAPENMVLSVAGDVDPGQVRAWAEEFLGGDWGRRYGGRRARPAEPAASGIRAAVRAEDVKEVYFNLAFSVPGVDHPDTPALDVLAMLLGQGDASRLSLEIKRKRSLVNSIHAYAYTPVDPGLFVVSATLPADSLEPALRETLRTLRQLREGGVPSEELITVKALIEAEAIYHRETVQGVARKLGFYETSGGGIEAEARYYERVSAVSTDDIRTVAQRYLRLEHAVVSALLPSGTPTQEGWFREVLAAAEREPAGVLPARRRAEDESSLRVRPLARPAPARQELVVEKLPSGATLIVREERSVPLFAVRAAFLGGARYEREETAGLNYLLARMLTRGTPAHDAEQISNLVDDLAGALSGVHGRNTIGLRGEFLAKHFERAFDLFAECLATPSFPEAELARERGLLLQEIHSRDDKPSSLAFDLFARTLYTRHPYRLPSLGEARSVERSTRAELARFHADYLNPAQMTLAVIGDVRADRVVEMASRLFGKAGTPKPPPEIPAEPALAEPRIAKRTLPRAQTHLVLGFLGETVDSPRRHALELLTTILSGQGGRLFRQLRDKQSLAYSVSSYSTEGIEPGQFAVYMGTSPDKVEVAMEGIRAELRKVLEDGVTEPELARAKTHLIGTHEIGLQRNGDRAALLALDFVYGLGAEVFLRYPQMVSAVTREQVQDEARRIIDLQRSALAMVGP